MKNNILVTKILLVCAAALLIMLILVSGACSKATPTTGSQEVIDPAPIHEVNTSLLKTNPPQVSVYIKGGLRDGCTTFNNIEVTREGNTVNIKVTTKHPKEAVCPAIYGYFEKNINLGSDFTIATTYTLKVNDYTTTFAY
jgi:hypothetical protein